MRTLYILKKVNTNYIKLSLVYAQRRQLVPQYLRRGTLAEKKKTIIMNFVLNKTSWSRVCNIHVYTWLVCVQKFVCYGALVACK